eukprot:20989-Ditylum_brightwellii.AAC.1
MQITEDDLKLSKSRHNLEQIQATTNIYISLWKPLSCPIKTAMQMHANSHNTDLHYFTTSFDSAQAQATVSLATNNSASTTCPPNLAT